MTSTRQPDSGRNSTWRSNAAFALGTIAQHDRGLEDDVIRAGGRDRARLVPAGGAAELPERAAEGAAQRGAEVRGQVERLERLERDAIASE